MARHLRHASRGRDELASLRDELEAVGGRLARLGQQRLADGQGRFTEELAKLQDAFDSTIDRLAAERRKAAARVGETVQEHPFAIVAAAFAAGAAVALMLGRRGS